MTDDYPTCEETYVTLRVYHDSADPASPWRVSQHRAFQERQCNSTERLTGQEQPGLVNGAITLKPDGTFEREILNGQ